MDSLVDTLADLRYRLGHAAVSDEFVEYLNERLDSLRSRYRRSRNESRPDDIAFLQRLAALLPMLEQYLSLDSKLQFLLERDRLTSELISLHAEIGRFNEPSFDLVCKQLAARLKEVTEFLKTPNPALNTDARQASLPRAG